MRYILIILVFISVGANAQMVIKAHANYRPLVQPVTNLLLDDYPNAAAAYSLRKLDKDYTGSAIRVRKDTTGQPEQDIGFTASGDLDTAALKSFLNARNGFVVTWYDQSGNGINATRTVQADQPQIANLGVIRRDGDKPCVRFQDDTDILISASSYTATHFFTIAKVNTVNLVNYILGNLTGGFQYNGNIVPNIGLGGFDGVTSGNIGGGDLNRHLGYFSLRTNRLFIGKDGAAEINVSSFAPSITLSRLGGRGTAAEGLQQLQFLGNIQEVIAWNSNQSSNRTGIESNINTHYGIY